MNWHSSELHFGEFLICSNREVCYVFVFVFVFFPITSILFILALLTLDHFRVRFPLGFPTAPFLSFSVYVCSLTLTSLVNFLLKRTTVSGCGKTSLEIFSILHISPWNTDEKLAVFSWLTPWGVPFGDSSVVLQSSSAPAVGWVVSRNSCSSPSPQCMCIWRWSFYGGNYGWAGSEGWGPDLTEPAFLEEETLSPCAHSHVVIQQRRPLSAN